LHKLTCEQDLSPHLSAHGEKEQDTKINLNTIIYENFILGISFIFQFHRSRGAKKSHWIWNKSIGMISKGINSTVHCEKVVL
jgi:hypothetical protein